MLYARMLRLIGFGKKRNIEYSEIHLFILIYCIFFTNSSQKIGDIQKEDSV